MEDIRNELTKEERLAISRLRRAFASLPSSLIVYVLDDQAEVCKKGVPSDDICESVGRGLMATNMLTDVHDDMNCGRT